MKGDLAAFVVLTFILAVTPGASTTMVVRNVIEHGRRAGYVAAAGAAAGNLTWAVAAAFGLAAVVTRAPFIADIIRIGGAAYLGVTGLVHLKRALAGSREHDSGRATRTPAISRGAFVQGLLTNLLNPPVGIYYLTIVPSFLPTPVILQPRFALYAAIHIGIAFCCHAAWATGFHALSRLWAHPIARRALEAVIGCALLMLGLRLVIA